MSSQRTESFRRGVRWLWPAALLALTPKCFLCVLGYAGLGAALGLSGPEICGGSAGSPPAWGASTALFGTALGIAGLLMGFRRRRASSAPQGSSS